MDTTHLTTKIQWSAIQAQHLLSSVMQVHQDKFWNCFLGVCVQIPMETEQLTKSFFPISVRHLPPWFPFAQFKRRALQARIDLANMREEPFKHAEKNIVRVEQFR